MKYNIFLRSWNFIKNKNIIYPIVILATLWILVGMLIMDHSYYKLTAFTAIAFLYIGVITVMNISFLHEKSTLLKYKKYILHPSILYIMMLPLTAAIIRAVRSLST